MLHQSRAMGYLDAFPTRTLPPPPSVSGGSYTPPTRTTRDRCWAARDAFFACLDAHGVVDAARDPVGVRTAHEKCGAQDEALGRECATSWVSVRARGACCEWLTCGAGQVLQGAPCHGT